MKTKQFNPFEALRAMGRQRLTPKSARNKEIDAKRAQRDPYAGGVPFQRGGGRFYTPKMMSALRHSETIINSQAKRENKKPRPLFYGDAW